ncbi:MAG TPA: hypothetical protein VL382_09075 [Terriglobales bacterium]|nr:hypothetical protein [Terriglobales bacterium]
MQRTNLVLALILLLAAAAAAQVLSPSEVPDVLGQRLQLQHMKLLQEMAADLRALKLPYAFYFSRKLDIDEATQRQSNQSSIQFVKREGLSLLQITGNYYASYSGETLDGPERARRTFHAVIEPMLRVEVAHLANDDSFGGYAFEISYHVRHKVLGIDSEGIENLALIVPREAGERIAHAKTEEDEQAALLDGAAYLDAEPFLLWVGKEKPSEAEQARILKGSLDRQADPQAQPDSLARAGSKPRDTVNDNLIRTPEWLKPKPVTADEVEKLNAYYQSKLEAMARELDREAHLVSYAPPLFIAFRDNAYIQLSMSTPLPEGETGTQYKLAALAFDSHISHLIRPVLKQLPPESKLAGVDFSTTVSANGKAESVEFIIPVVAMDCFAKYECSGQQLVSSSVVLINGERANLDLERAER